MRLNLPDFLRVKETRLIVGCGGGWDFIGGLPLAIESEGTTVFANYSSHRDDFAYTDRLQDCRPEGFVDLDYKFYVLGRHGVGLVRAAIENIIESHRVDTVIVMDGGVDGLMHGDEVGAGTFFEDTITLTAVNGISGVKKYFCSLGFGTETDEGLNHYRALENMSLLMKQSGFLGSCALSKEMPSFQKYKSVILEGIKAGTYPSHIHTKIIAAVQGDFGDSSLFYDSRLSYSTGEMFLNPLMSLYWFFDLEKVISNNKFSSMLEYSNTYIDAKILLRHHQNVELMNKREHLHIPL